MGFSSSSKRRAMFNDINITPLTDIFLVLLIIMMVIAPMLDSQGLKLAVPTVSPSSDIKQEPKTIKIEVTEQGQYLLNGDAIEASRLKRALSQIKSDYPDGLIIETQAKATHGAMVTAMDAARGAGIIKIAVAQSGE